MSDSLHKPDDAASGNNNNGKPDFLSGQNASGVPGKPEIPGITVESGAASGSVDSSTEGTGPGASNADETEQNSGKRFGNPLLNALFTGFSSPLARCGFIFFITLVLLIPLDFVRTIVSDRQYLQNEALRSITESWGNSQSVSGPILLIPYEVWDDIKDVVVVLKDGVKQSQEVVRREYSVRHKIILPTELNFTAVLDPEIRYRGIYRQALYNAPVDLRGNFTLPGQSDFAKNLHRVHWDKAWIAVGISDLKTISEEKPVQWNGSSAAAYKPGTGAGNILGPGFHAAIPLTEQAAGMQQDFEIQLKVRGSGGIFFTPVGEKTSISMAGTWPDPSFQGNLLPVERHITPEGFSAKWLVSNLTRSYPQTGDLEGHEFDRSPHDEQSAITSFTVGVDLHEGVSLYRMVMRAVNYGLLFIAVSFVALFAFEMVTRQRMHLLQYGMVGLSMSLFYLVLLSLAEHVSFALSFTAAGAVIVLMNSLYIASALGSKKQGLIMGALLSGLYALLFSLLRMEDFALLVGTALVLAMMGVLMFVTRRLPQSSQFRPDPSGQSGRKNGKS